MINIKNLKRSFLSCVQISRITEQAISREMAAGPSGPAVFLRLVFLCLLLVVSGSARPIPAAEEDGILTAGMVCDRYPFVSRADWAEGGFSDDFGESLSGDEDQLSLDDEAGYIDLTGIDPDVAVQLACIMHMGLQLCLYGSREDMMEDLREGRIDMGMGGIMRERCTADEPVEGIRRIGDWHKEKEDISFSIPYLTYNASVVCLAGEKETILPYPYVMKGKNIGVISMYGEDSWTKHYRIPSAGIIHYASDWEACRALKNKEADCLVTGRRMAAYLVRQDEGLQFCRGENRDFLFSDHYVIAVRSEDETFLEMLNDAIRRMILGQYNRGNSLPAILRRQMDPFDAPDYPALNMAAEAAKEERMQRIARSAGADAEKRLTEAMKDTGQKTEKEIETAS